MIDSVFHSNVSDLLFLLSHEGVTDTLVLNAGESGVDFIGCKLSDASSVLIDEGEAPFTGTFKPHNPLSIFSGMNPNGEWKLTIIDESTGNSGTLQSWGLKLFFDNATDVKFDNSSIPNDFKIYQNYPNPFNPSTTIKYSIPHQSKVILKIYDVLGNEIETLVNEEKFAGNYEVEFNPVSSNLNLASGIYFYQLKVGEYVHTMKMILLK